jgi:hypothetical protein
VKPRHPSARSESRVANRDAVREEREIAHRAVWVDARLSLSIDRCIYIDRVCIYKYLASKRERRWTRAWRLRPLQAVGYRTSALVKPDFRKNARDEFSGKERTKARRKSARGPQLPCDGLESGNSLRAQPLDDSSLSPLPGRITPSQQRHSLFSHRNLMAAPVVVTRLQTKPSPGAHARDIAAQR